MGLGLVPCSANCVCPACTSQSPLDQDTDQHLLNCLGCWYVAFRHICRVCRSISTSSLRQTFSIVFRCLGPGDRTCNTTVTSMILSVCWVCGRCLALQLRHRRSGQCHVSRHATFVRALLLEPLIFDELFAHPRADPRVLLVLRVVRWLRRQLALSLPHRAARGVVAFFGAVFAT